MALLRHHCGAEYRRPAGYLGHARSNASVRALPPDTGWVSGSFANAPSRQDASRRASDGPGGTDLGLSRRETGLAEGRQKQLVEVRPEEVLCAPSLNDHEPTTVLIPDVQHEPIGRTAQVVQPGVDRAFQPVMVTLFRGLDKVLSATAARYLPPASCRRL